MPTVNIKPIIDILLHSLQTPFIYKGLPVSHS